MMHPVNRSSRFLLREGQGWARTGVRVLLGEARGGGERRQAGWLGPPVSDPRSRNWRPVSLEKAVDPGQLWEKGGAILRDVSLNGQLQLRMGMLGAGWQVRVVSGKQHYLT